jgi:6,7-dimethyl-8-ribityllumazine synthase
MKKILIINSSFYQKISEELLKGCQRVLEKNSVEFDTIEILGAFEIPATLAILRNDSKYKGYIALGCVIRGDTTHYDYVCLESIRGINQLAIDYKLAVGNGIITVENEQQALDRVADNNNKGAFAAEACLQMIEIKKTDHSL